MFKKLDKIFNESKRFYIDNNSKIVIMSDCHRGTGDNFDNFFKNKNLFEAALRDYYKNGFSYIELGDGDEMWETRCYREIVEEYSDIFKLLKRFNEENKLVMIYGNHDMCKRSKKILKDTFYYYFNKETNKNEKLLSNLIAYESIILSYEKNEMFLIHGHQVDIINGNLWKFSRFLVRYFWKPLERFGIKDPTSSVKNYRKRKKVDKKLEKWSRKNNKILISGHTHRPTFPKVGESLYFNDGSCIHPNGISCLEIENGYISLVKWVFVLENNNYISVRKILIDGPELIINYFKIKKVYDYS